MTSILREVWADARRQHGLVSHLQLVRHSIGRHQRSRLVRHGTLVPVHRRVYRIASHPVTFEQRCLAACLSHDGLVICGPSAGRLLNLRKMRTGPVHAMSHRTKVDLAGVVIHRTTTLGSGDITHRADGTRLLKPSRLVPDLARFLDDDDLESVIEQLLDRRLTSIPALYGSARRLRRPGRDGTVRLARVLDARPPWRKPMDSDLEVRLMRALTARGIPLVPQYRLDVNDSVPIRLDAADPDRCFGIEVDHVTWHGGRLDVQRDKARDRMAMRMGWTVTRVTDTDLAERFEATIDEICVIHARPRLDRAS